jgi:ferritin
MNQKVEKAINQQINEELFSFYLYLSMSAYFESKNMKGVANWFSVQSKEEHDHAMGFYKYLLSRGGMVELLPIKKPMGTFKGLMHALEETYTHEQHITKCIHDLYALALQEKDYALQSFLKWYIDEQVEEEANDTALLDQLKLYGDKGPSLFLLDQQMGQRIYTPLIIPGVTL